jgi:cytochrome c oxidase subunit II
MDWILPPGVTTYAADIDRLYYLILAITGVVFLLTQGLLFWFLIRYRKREGSRAEYIHGSTKAEILWTAVPFVIVVALGLMSKGLWDDIKDPDRIPADAYEIRVSARQFEWEARYAGADGVFGTDADFTLLNRMHVPVNRPVVVHLTAEDVIHSFFVPAFRVKQDAVPGMTISVWFEVNEAGDYAMACAELCGTGHFRMDGRVIVQSDNEFRAWEAERFAVRAEAGARLAAAASATSGSEEAR